MTRHWNGPGSEESEQKLRRRRTRPTGHRRLEHLTDEDESADELVSRLTGLGHITAVVSELKSGKEATASSVPSVAQPCSRFTATLPSAVSRTTPSTVRDRWF